MANIRTIKRRIKTTKNIAQTTKAMELVAASRMRKAQILANQSKPYADRLIKITRGLMGKIKLKENSKLTPFFNSAKKEGKTAIILITPDKGLAGALVSNFSRYLLKFISMENKKMEDYEFLIYGKKGRNLILKYKGQITAQFDMGMTQPQFDKVSPVIRLATEGYINNQYNRVLLFYTDFINTLSQQPKIVQILPLIKNQYEKTEEITPGKLDYLFEPNPEQVLTDLIPHYLESEIYHALLESYASEQSARMSAMKNATDNANEIISEMTLFYNKARQQVITSEISDIITATLAVS